MKTKLLLFILIVPLFLTGCWDLVEIENRSYVINMGIDISEDNKYKVTYGMAWNNDKERKGSVRSIEGEKLSYILANSDMALDKRTYFGHTKTIIFGEGVVKNKDVFSDVLNALRENKELSSKVLVMKCNGSAEDAVNVISEEKQMYIWNFYRTNADEMGHIEKTTLEDIASEIESCGITVIPVITPKGEEIEFSGCGIISEGELKRSFGKEKSEFMYLLKGYGKGALLSGDGYTIKVIKPKRKIKIENGICRIIFNLKGEFIYSENEIDINSIEKEQKRDIENFIKEEILTLSSGDYFDISKYLIKGMNVNINNIRYKDFEIVPEVNIEIQDV